MSTILAKGASQLNPRRQTNWFLVALRVSDAATASKKKKEKYTTRKGLLADKKLNETKTKRERSKRLHRDTPSPPPQLISALRFHYGEKGG